MPRLNKAFLALLIGCTALAFTASNTPQPAYAAVWCSCVQYVRNLLGIPGGCGCADQYGACLQSGGYTQVGNPQVGAVLILRHDFPGADPSCGHIGVIRQVQSVNGDSAWQVLMRSAAWGGTGDDFTDAGCNNVSDNWTQPYAKGDARVTYWVWDVTAPVTSASVSGTMGNNSWYRSSVQVTLTATDDLSGVAGTWYSIDGGGYAGYGGPFTVSAQGNHTVNYYSRDNAGNQESPKSTSFKIDSVPPSTSASGFSGIPGENSWYTSDGSLTLSASDAISGVYRVAYRLDGGPEQTYSSPIPISGDGAHTIQHWAIDNAGNTGTPITTPIRIDGTAPSGFILLNNGSPATPGAAVMVGSSMSDVTSGLASQRFSNNGANSSGWAPYEERSRWTIPVVNGVAATVYAQFKDTAGNISDTLTDSITPMINVQPSASASYRLLKSHHCGWRPALVISKLPASGSRRAAVSGWASFQLGFHHHLGILCADGRAIPARRFGRRWVCRQPGTIHRH